MADSSRWPDIEQMPRALRIAGRVLLWLSPVVLLSALAVIVMYVRLLQGPISLKVMAGPIERGISAGLRGLSAKVDDALLRRSPAGAIEFQLVNLRLFEEDGSVVASAPVAAVGMDLARLAMLDVQPTRIELIEPRVSVSYSARDGLALSFTETPPAENENPPEPGSETGVTVAPAPEPSSPSAVPSVLRRLDLARVISEYAAKARQQRDATASLSQIGFRNAIVDVDYEGRRSSWKVGELSIDLDHKRRHSVISVAARIESERGPWSLSLLTEDFGEDGNADAKGVRAGSGAGCPGTSVAQSRLAAFPRNADRRGRGDPIQNIRGIEWGRCRG